MIRHCISTASVAADASKTQGKTKDKKKDKGKSTNNEADVSMNVLLRDIVVNGLVAVKKCLVLFPIYIK